MKLPANEITANPLLVREVKSLKALKDCLKGAELMGLSLTNVSASGTFPRYETAKEIEDRAILNEWLTGRGESPCEPPYTVLYGVYTKIESLVLKTNYLLLTYLNGDKFKLLLCGDSSVTLEFK